MSPGSALLAALVAAASEGVAPNAERWTRFVDMRPGDVVEVQTLKVRPPSGGEMNLFADATNTENFARLLSEIERYEAPAVYTILNGVRPEVALARELELDTWWQLTPPVATKDKDIAYRSALYVDLDVVRPTNTSSTDVELLACAELAAKVYCDLGTLLGGDEALGVGLSGNGCAIFIALDRLPETPGLGALVKETLLALRALYETSTIKIDTRVSDSKRLAPAFGTLKCKGPANDSLRPHRRTGFMCHDTTVRRLSQAELVELLASLRERLPAPLAAPASTSIVETIDIPEDLTSSLAEARKKLQDLRRFKSVGIGEKDRAHYEILTKLLSSQPLAVPGERSNVVNLTVSLLAYHFDAWEVVAEIIRPSVAAMNAEPPEDTAHWMRVGEASYLRAHGRAERHKEEREQKRVENEALRNVLVNITPPAALVASATPPTSGQIAASFQAAAASSADSSADSSWMDLLTKTADGKIKECSYNVYIILSHSPTFKGTIQFNLLSKVVEVTSGIYKGVAQPILPQKIAHWLHANAKITIKRHELEDQILVVAYENAYDPVVDYLESLQWDGVPRLDNFFFTYAKARMTSKAGRDLTAHLRRIAPMFFISAVARQIPLPGVANSGPGCQVDSMMILEGTFEGEGKTEFFRILFGLYYITMRRDLNEKDSAMIPAQNWGSEFSELSAMSRSDDRVLKGFLTERVDKYRPPYGRQYVSCPRRCVFVGSTNEEEWNSQSKGRRRFWPVFVETVDYDAVRRDRDQLWAEAVVRYKAGEKWYLSREERVEADAEAEARMTDSYYQTKISTWWHEREPRKRPDVVTLVELVEQVLKLPSADRVSPSIVSSVNQAMTRIGFQRDYANKRTIAWNVPDELKGRPAYLRVVRTPEEVVGDIADAPATPAGEKKE